MEFSNSSSSASEDASETSSSDSVPSDPREDRESRVAREAREALEPLFLATGGLRFQGSRRGAGSHCRIFSARQLDVAPVASSRRYHTLWAGAASKSLVRSFNTPIGAAKSSGTFCWPRLRPSVAGSMCARMRATRWAMSSSGASSSWITERGFEPPSCAAAACSSKGFFSCCFSYRRMAMSSTALAPVAFVSAVNCCCFCTSNAALLSEAIPFTPFPPAGMSRPKTEDSRRATMPASLNTGAITTTAPGEPGVARRAVLFPLESKRRRAALAATPLTAQSCTSTSSTPSREAPARRWSVKQEESSAIHRGLALS
mmetsp:Transcript_28016/g.96864  ORF Transcript_28016/g.96864 Transcript_28016/m.96864 type:complete len:315 (-) Transcript_28016:572-1516(-)